MHADGTESKGFHIRDGAAIVWAQRAGLPVGLLSARRPARPAQRAAQLAIRIVQQGVRTRPRLRADPARAGARRSGRGLHGRRSARSAGAARAPACRQRPPMPRRRSATRVALGQHARRRTRRGAGVIELVLRAQDAGTASLADYRSSADGRVCHAPRRPARAARRPGRSARRGSATSSRTAAGSIGGARASLPTTCSA